MSQQKAKQGFDDAQITGSTVEWLELQPNKLAPKCNGGQPSHAHTKDVSLTDNSILKMDDI